MGTCRTRILKLLCPFGPEQIWLLQQPSMQCETWMLTFNTNPCNSMACLSFLCRATIKNSPPVHKNAQWPRKEHKAGFYASKPKPPNLVNGRCIFSIRWAPLESRSHHLHERCPAAGQVSAEGTTILKDMQRALTYAGATSEAKGGFAVFSGCTSMNFVFISITQTWICSPGILSELGALILCFTAPESSQPKPGSVLSRRPSWTQPAAKRMLPASIPLVPLQIQHDRSLVQVILGYQVSNCFGRLRSNLSE